MVSFDYSSSICKLRGFYSWPSSAFSIRSATALFKQVRHVTAIVVWRRPVHRSGSVRMLSVVSVVWRRATKSSVSLLIQRNVQRQVRPAMSTLFARKVLRCSNMWWLFLWPAYLSFSCGCCIRKKPKDRNLAYTRFIPMFLFFFFFFFYPRIQQYESLLCLSLIEGRHV